MTILETKYVCNRCGTETESMTDHRWLSIGIDLCDSCRNSFDRWIKDGKRQMPKRNRDGKFLPSRTKK